MTASEFEQPRAEQEREDSEEGYLQLGVIGAVMGGEPLAVYASRPEIQRYHPTSLQ